jgi:tRNA-dihydrouridine synthase 1
MNVLNEEASSSESAPCEQLRVQRRKRQRCSSGVDDCRSSDRPDARGDHRITAAAAVAAAAQGDMLGHPLVSPGWRGTLARAAAGASCGSSGLPFPVTRVAAPMVGASDFAFRLLCRRHGADTVYSPMLDPERLTARCSAYRDAMLLQDGRRAASGSGLCDRPLVVQLSGHNPATLAAAAMMLAGSGCCDAVDLNLGCPQQHAADNLYGALQMRAVLSLWALPTPLGVLYELTNQGYAAAVE